ncbi:hypothetical protein [Algoriphagus machipongonensis]|uniref:Lipoprotein n=1 Tax=Algoriphagus machipongonensis TaxID=388413 RepID=A3HSP2_9BACT|nr:hypothetical protein [Algoriphagus machipongonensis]EAZ82860.1 hypothetical protein ALPR1_11605 [Algoriphagus machipongonensis]
MMHRNFVHLLFIGAFILGTQSCGDLQDLDKTEVYWDQTGCADPWNLSNNSSDEELKSAILDYLKVEGIKKARITRISNEAEAQVCYACFCTTGKRFHLEVPINQKSKLLSLGFKES